MNDLLGKIGVVLIFVGGGALVGLAVAAFMVIKNPEEFELARLILSSLDISGPLISGRLDDREFIVDAAKPLRYVFFGVTGLALVSMMVSIGNAMVINGIRLAKYSAEHKSPSENEEVMQP